MFCTKCGRQLDDGLKFCTACGNPVPVPEKKQDVEAEMKPEAEVAEMETVIEAESAEPEKADEPKAQKAPDETAVIDTPAEEAVEAEETAVMEPVEVVDADAETVEEKKSFDLPDSALEPSTPEPARDVPSTSVALDETAVMPAVVVADGGSGGTDDSSDFSGGKMPPDPSPKKTRRKAVIGICSAAAAVIIAAIGVLVVLDPFNPNTPIDSDSFPNDIIRDAVLNQLDEDGDGRLSDKEAQLVTALVYTPDGAEFVTEGNEVDVQTIRESIQQRNPKADDGSNGGESQQGSTSGDTSVSSNDQSQANDGGADVQTQGSGGGRGQR